jgi:hypothetical protein
MLLAVPFLAMRTAVLVDLPFGAHARVNVSQVAQREVLAPRAGEPVVQPTTPA